MEFLNYVRRCKKKTGHERHETLHAADNNATLCGKELNEMWFIEPNADLGPDDVSCKKCRAALHCGSWSKKNVVEDQNCDFVKHEDFIEVKDVALALLEYIDAIPDGVDFEKTMPGVDRELVENILGV